MKKILLLVFISTSLVIGISAQNLEIKRGNKVNSFKQGEQIRLILTDAECTSCGSGYYEGEFVKATNDSITLSLKEEHFYLDDQGNRQRTAYYFQDDSRLINVGKSKVLKIKSQKNKINSRKGLIAGFAMATATIATFINSAIITQTESVKKLRQIGVVEAAVSAVLISGSVALQGRKYKIGTNEKDWTIL